LKREHERARRKLLLTKNARGRRGLGERKPGGPLSTFHSLLRSSLFALLFSLFSSFSLFSLSV